MKTKFPQNPLHTFRSDNGTEYINKDLTSYCRDNEIRHETSNTYSPQQNGISERKNRTLGEAMRSLLFAARLPVGY
jgi:transposase InsO family protein